MLTDGLFKMKHFIPLHDDILLFLISFEGIFWTCVSKPLPPLPCVSAEADTHSNVQIYQEREIERGSE